MGRQKTTGRIVKPKGVGFEPGVLEYLQFITTEVGGSRSSFINRLVKDDAAKRGMDVSQFKTPPTQQTA